MIASPLSTMTEAWQRERVTLLADLVAADLASTAEGHCARVNFLDRAEAAAVCRALRDRASRRLPNLHAYVLTHAGGPSDDSAISTDRAIELRNRKRGTLCLFIPPDAVDATVSSLGNSFAEINGRNLHQRALEQVLAGLQPTTRDIVRRVFGELRGSASATHDEQLELALVAAQRERDGQRDRIGLELWRVGLIADARADFANYVTGNRRHVRLLARPQRLSASCRDRVANLKVSRETAQALETFFARRPLHAVRQWSRDLAAGKGPTYDAWVFPDVARSDLTTVDVVPFTDPHGAVLKNARIRQPDGPHGSLLAGYGDKAYLSVGWRTMPAKPTNVHRWHVAITPASEASEADDQAGLDLPAREVKGTARRARLKLNLEFDEPPEPRFCVRVVAVDEAGNDIAGEDGVALAATSEEFYLVPADAPVQGATRERRRTVQSLAEGRLRAALETKEAHLALASASWIDGRTVTYYTVRVDPRTMLALDFSPFLLALERRTLAEPSSGGRYRVEIDEVRPATIEELSAIPSSVPIEGDFWRLRKLFFDKVRGDGKAGGKEGVIAAADWSADLTNAALRYAQAYSTLLLENAADPKELALLLRLDTVQVRLDTGEDVEVATVVLPTHPLRAAWYASHAALLRKWEERLLAQERRQRRAAVDLELLGELQPTNMPAFVPGDDGQPPEIFFRNLAFQYGVALPAAVLDPLRRFQDVARILGVETPAALADRGSANRLAQHLRDFVTVHPYADPLRLLLANPDQGDLLAGALDQVLAPGAPMEEENEPPVALALDVTAYVHDERQSALHALDMLRTRQHEQRSRYGADHLRPGLATTVRPMRRLAEEDAEDAHVAIASDMIQPTVVALPVHAEDDTSSSLSLYGLVSRFHADFETQDDDVVWRYCVAAPPSLRGEAHPAGSRFGETLVETQRAILRATAKLIAPDRTDRATPGLEVRLDRERRDLLDRLHERTDWVITLDRFFGVDYYDSPQDRSVARLATTYLIDYSPEFVDGLGERLIVTTARHDEIALVLRRAMQDIGFAATDHGVGRVLHYLKTVSGRLALQALNQSSDAAEAVSLGIVTAWLRAKGRSGQAVLVPVDAHRELFSPRRLGVVEPGQHGCAMILFSLRRRVVDATFIEVKWRRGPLGDIADLAEDMGLRLRRYGEAAERRFFNLDRVDGALQRSYLATVLRFYCARAQRHGLLDAAAAAAFLANVALLERSDREFQPSYEGYIVSLEDAGRGPLVNGDLTVRVLTASDIEEDAYGLPAAGATSSSTPSLRSFPPQPWYVSHLGQGPSDDTESALPPLGHPSPTNHRLSDRATDVTPRPSDLPSHGGHTPSDGVNGSTPSLRSFPPQRDTAAAEDSVSSSGAGLVIPLSPDDSPTGQPAVPGESGTARPMSGSESGEPVADADADTLASATELPAATSMDPRETVSRAVPFVVLGESRSGDVVWSPSVQGSPHLFMTGIPGQGKSWTTLHILNSLAHQGLPALVFDFHGQLATENAYVNVTHPTVIDAAQGLPFSPFECNPDNSSLGWGATALALAEIFAYVAGLGPIQQDVLFTSLRDAYKARGFGPAMLSRLPESIPTLDDLRRRIEAQERQRRTQNLSARLRPLLEMDVFRPPEEGHHTFGDALRGGLVVDLHQLTSEMLQLAAGAFLLRKLYRDMFGWGMADRPRLVVALDEAHRLARDLTLPKLMKEGRKFGIVVVTASQGLSDFHENVLANAGTKVSFRANHPESRKVAGYFRAPHGQNLVTVVEQLRVGQALVQTPEMSYAARVEMRAPAVQVKVPAQP